MTDNNYKPMSDKKMRKIPGMITGENKVWADLRRTLLCAFVKKIYELYFWKGIFRKKAFLFLFKGKLND